MPAQLTYDSDIKRINEWVKRETERYEAIEKQEQELKERREEKKRSQEKKRHEAIEKQEQELKQRCEAIEKQEQELKERLEEKKRREAIEKQYIRQLDMQHIHDYLQDGKGVAIKTGGFPPSDI